MTVEFVRQVSWTVQDRTTRRWGVGTQRRYPITNKVFGLKVRWEDGSIGYYGRGAEEGQWTGVASFPKEMNTPPKNPDVLMWTAPPNFWGATSRGASNLSLVPPALDDQPQPQ